jgi:hypothetical protein
MTLQPCHLKPALIPFLPPHLSGRIRPAPPLTFVVILSCIVSHATSFGATTKVISPFHTILGGEPVPQMRRKSPRLQSLHSSSSNDNNHDEPPPPLVEPKKRKRAVKAAAAATLTDDALPRTRQDQLQHTTCVCMGIDEAGRGPLAGPVVAAAAMVPATIPGITDSKQLTKEHVREELYQSIVQSPNVRWAVAVVDAPTIDEINILQATLKAMTMAAQSVIAPCPNRVPVACIRIQGSFVAKPMEMAYLFHRMHSPHWTTIPRHMLLLMETRCPTTCLAQQKQSSRGTRKNISLLLPLFWQKSREID